MGVNPNRSAWLKNHPKPATPVSKIENGENEAKPLVASDLLRPNHPLRQTFKDWCINKGVEESKRQASKFLRDHPAYRQASPA